MNRTGVTPIQNLLASVQQFRVVVGEWDKERTADLRFGEYLKQIEDKCEAIRTDSQDRLVVPPPNPLDV